MAKQPVPFYEVFKQVVLYRTGLTVSETELHKELLEHELELALRLGGLAGDSEGPTIAILEEPEAQDKDGKGREGKEKDPKDQKDQKDQKESKESKGKGKDKGEGKGKGEQSGSGNGWSADAEKLLRLVKRLGPRNPNLCSSAFLKNFFRDLRLPQLRVGPCLGEAAVGFSQLLSLDVSRNYLVDIAYLPPNLRFLRAYNNRLTRLSCKPLASLCFLGLGFNPLGDAGFADASKFPNLLSLDAGNTDTASLANAKLKLKPLAMLRHLCLLGSPVCLLPFYRLQLIHQVPQLQVLDGLAPSEEELAEAQQLPETGEACSSHVPESAGGGLDWCRVTLAFGQLTSHQELLREALLTAADEEAIASQAAEAAAAGEEVVERDALAEKCGQESQLRLTFQLPNGIWVATSSINLCKKTYEVEEGQPPPPVVLKESLKLKALRQESGEQLSFDLRFDEDLGGLRALRQWLQRGLQIKLWYLAKPSETPETAQPPEAKVDSGMEDAKPADSADGGATEVAAETGEDAEVVAEAAPSSVKEDKDGVGVCLGGCVVPLSCLLQRTPTSIGYPDPWQHVAEVSVVSVAHWLNPEIQVPKERDKEKAEKVEKPAPAAQLDLVLSLYATPLEDVVESEEEAPPAPKAKAKAKGKK